MKNTAYNMELKRPMKNTVISLITIVLFFIGIILGIVINKSKSKPHTCEFVTCPYKGETKFKNDICGCEPGTDCSALDSIHFFNPAWNYDQCEDYLFKPAYLNKTDYQINIHFDTLWLYDGKRLVGRIDYTKEKLDSLIWIDNE